MVENEELINTEAITETSSDTAENFEHFYLTPDEVDVNAEPVEADNAETPVEPEKLIQPALVEDFAGIAESVYEAVMLAAQRARHIGKKQKKEIDAWTRSLETTMTGDLEEESPDQGVDHFHHPKPTVQALLELKNNRISFTYPADNG